MTTPAWDGWAKVRDLLVRAGRTLEPKITVVERGIPASIPTDMIRVWYDGNGDSPFGSDTLGATQEGLKLTVGVFLLMGAATSVEAEKRLDERIEAADNAIQDALFGDPNLDSGNAPSAIGIEIEGTSANAVQWSGQNIRYVEIPITYGLPDRHAITP